MFNDLIYFSGGFGDVLGTFWAVFGAILGVYLEGAWV